MAEIAAKTPKSNTGSTAVRDLFDAKEKVQSTHTSELVIALCGPIGSPLHKVAETIKHSLENEFDYERATIVRLSSLIENQAGKSVANGEHQRIKKLIDLGDDLRNKHGASVLAELSINEIALDRQKTKAKTESEIFKPRRVCHILDSIKNQEELDILKLVYRDMLYFVGVFSPMQVRVKALEKRGMTAAEVYELIDRDSGEELDHGQTVRDTFPEADFFLRIDSDTDTQIKARVDRFLHLILGTKIITPSYAENAMYLASSASGNSACLSRQVGAAVTDKHGEIIAVGWNDVPKFGGNLYMSDLKADANGDNDKRCWNIDGGTCFNDKEKRVISELLIDTLVDKGLVSKDDRGVAIANVISNTKVKDLIEFSRSIHAEMHAISTISSHTGRVWR